MIKKICKADKKICNQDFIIKQNCQREIKTFTKYGFGRNIID